MVAHAAVAQHSALSGNVGSPTAISEGKLWRSVYRDGLSNASQRHGFLEAALQTLFKSSMPLLDAAARSTGQR
jgi:hypothetical protein